MSVTDEDREKAAELLRGGYRQESIAGALAAEREKAWKSGYDSATALLMARVTFRNTIEEGEGVSEPEEARVERVARAILKDWIRRYPNDNEPWEFQREDGREDYRRMARAAIAALESR